MASSTESLPYRAVRYIGSGSFGSVFEVFYKGQQCAMKVQRSTPRDWLFPCAKAYGEVENLVRLKCIRGVPSPLGHDPFLEGDFKDLQLDLPGFPDRFKSSEVRFFSPFFMELMGSSRNVKYAPNLTDRFFEELTAIILQVHERGFALPYDCSIVEFKGSPYVVDLSNLRPITNKNKEEDLEDIANWKAGKYYYPPKTVTV